MDLFGITLWTPLFYADRDWLSSMEVGTQDDFDPEDDLWDKLFSKLEKMLVESGKSKTLGGCYHISSEIARLTSDKKDFEIYPTYIKARNKFMEKFAFELGIHVSFSPNQYPLLEKFHSNFISDMNFCKTLEATSMVMHPAANPSYNHQDYMKLFVDDITTDDICDTLSDSSVVLGWENMISGQFSSLRSLVEFREMLVDKLKEIGRGNLIDQHQLCFDTGHLILWKAKHPSLSLAEKEIEEYLPKFAKNLKVYHIHANDGTMDFHITPTSTDFFEHKSRRGLKPELFNQYSTEVKGWIDICRANHGLENVHIHMETDKVPFSLDQTIDFAKSLK
jgi:Xylose isomerase-like TIM barrel